jgi:hypothetical protein
MLLDKMGEQLIVTGELHLFLLISEPIYNCSVAQARLRSGAIPCEICSGESDTATGFTPNA